MFSFMLKSLFIIIAVTEIVAVTQPKAIVKNVSTYIDISTQLITIDYSLTLISEENELKSFVFLIGPLQVDNLAYMHAWSENINSSTALYHGNGRWEVFFKNPLTKFQKENIAVQLIFTHALKPYPVRIKQHGRHLVLFSGYLSFISPYLCLNQTTHIALGEGKLESISKQSMFEMKNTSVLTFVSKFPIQPNTYSKVKLHYEPNSALLTVGELHRTITVPHWGTIQVEEEILLQNTGAKLHGPYNPSLNTTTSNTIKYVTSILPASATDIAVYDGIGLVWGVETCIKMDHVEMKLQLRFPLLGGWQIRYKLRYNVPSYEYLFTDNVDYLLKMRVVDHIFNDMIIDRAFVKIILPKGAEQISLRTPNIVKYKHGYYNSTYLDVFERPVIAFSCSNLIEKHMIYFNLHYRFSKYVILLAPMYRIVIIELIFIVVIICIRSEFLISINDKMAEEMLDSPSSSGNCLVKAD